MKFTHSLIKGKLQKRYKRFFADIEVNNKVITAHCPNTGSMKGLLNAGNQCWLTPHDDPKRKLKYTLEMIKVDKRLVGVNTHRANKIVLHALQNRLITEFQKIKNIKPEFKYSDDTRFDFLCNNNIIEVKNVTLIRENEIAEVPDAVTSRGTKHLNMLIKSKNKGFKPFVLFLTQIEGINNFRIAKDIDDVYYKNYLIAKKAGVKFLAYRCSLNSKEIKVEKKINILDE